MPQRRPPARRLAPLALLAGWGLWAGCGVLEAAVQDSVSRCQRLADKLSLCPDLFGRGVETTFLDIPSARQAGPVIAPAVASSREVQACAYRLSGSSEPCRGAFTALVDCIAPLACAEIAKGCAAPLAQARAACAALFVASPQGN